MNFDQLKTFSENYKSVRVWLWLIWKFTENYCLLRLLPYFIQTQKRYLTSLDKISIFLWTKLPKNLLPAEYFIYLAVAVSFFAKRSLNTPIIITTALTLLCLWQNVFFRISAERSSWILRKTLQAFILKPTFLGFINKNLSLFLKLFIPFSCYLWAGFL